ncbi:MAG: conjugal transfer protein TraI, partial [Nitrosospira sp.]
HELFMAHNAFGTELLLPGDAPRDLEHQQSEATHGLRRDVPDRGRGLAEEAARQYIAEREQKRAYISDIPPHALYRPGDSGSAAFAGWREISGQALVLLKGQESEIIVLPVNEETLEQVKLLRIGESLAYESDGTVQTRGLRL